MTAWRGPLTGASVAVTGPGGGAVPTKVRNENVLLHPVMAFERRAWETSVVSFSWGGRMVRAADPVGGEDRTPIAPAVGGPTVLRILLGAQLRRLREAKRITLEDAGRVIRASHSKISRLETGRVGFKDRDVSDLLTFYGVTDEDERETLRALARRASARSASRSSSSVTP